MKNVNDHKTDLAKDGLVFTEHKAHRGNACLPRQDDLKENMLEICIFQHYTNIFRTHYPDFFHMLAWRREVARPCVTVAVSTCYKKNGSLHAHSTETQMQIWGKASSPPLPSPSSKASTALTLRYCVQRQGLAATTSTMWCVKGVRPEF